MSVNANSFCVQCSVIASVALTGDRVLHYLPCQVKFHSLSFHVIDIERIFRRNNKLLYYRDPSNPSTDSDRENHLCAFGQNSHRRTDKITELLSVTFEKSTEKALNVTFFYQFFITFVVYFKIKNIFYWLHILKTTNI